MSIGAAPLTMPTLPTIGTDWTMCGFVLCDATSGTREIWAAGSNTRVRVTASATGWVVSATADGVSGMMSAALTLNRWYHVALRRSSTRTGLWIDGVEVGGGAPANANNAALDSADVTWGAGSAVGVCEIALDEWALLSSAIDVADLAGRARYARLFGGYVYGPKDDPVMGSGVGGRYITVNCVGYSKFLERAFLPQTLPVTAGEMVKGFVDRVLPLAEVPDVFTTNGIVLDEELEGGEFDYQSIAEVLRDLGKLFNAVSWVDAWGEIQLRLRGDSTISGVILTDREVVSCSQFSRPRPYANRIILIGDEDVVVVENDVAAQAAVGVVANRIRDRTVTTEALARAKAKAVLATSVVRSVICTIRTAPGKVVSLTPGAQLSLRLPQHDIDAVVLVERVTTTLERGTPDAPLVTHQAQLTAQNYEPRFADYWRSLQQAATE